MKLPGGMNIQGMMKQACLLYTSLHLLGLLHHALDVHATR